LSLAAGHGRPPDAGPSGRLRSPRPGRRPPPVVPGVPAQRRDPRVYRRRPLGARVALCVYL